MKLTPEKLTAFCAALAETAIVGKACAAVGISRQTAYEWRTEIPAFAEAWDRALKVGVSALEDEAHRRAFEGIDEPLTHQGQITPQCAVALDDEGQPILDELTQRPRLEPIVLPDGTFKAQTVKRYSDTLAIFLLKAHAPDKYRDNSRVELAGALAVQAMSEEDIRAELAALTASGVVPPPDDGSDLV